MTSITQKAPKHLRAPTRKWFESVLADYELEPHHVRILQLAAEAWDRCQQAREAIKKHGMTFENKYGETKNPARSRGRKGFENRVCSSCPRTQFKRGARSTTAAVAEIWR
jgi:phage terminase small subunit